MSSGGVLQKLPQLGSDGLGGRSQLGGGGFELGAGRQLSDRPWRERQRVVHLPAVSLVVDRLQ